jgi:type IV pilus assembly protein PilQ
MSKFAAFSCSSLLRLAGAALLIVGLLAGGLFPGAGTLGPQSAVAQTASSPDSLRGQSAGAQPPGHASPAGSSSPASSLPARADQLQRPIQPLGLSEDVHSTIVSLNVRGGDLRDVFRGIAAQYDVNLVVDPQIDRSVTLRLADVSVLDAIRFLCREYELELSQTGNILRVRQPEAPPPPPLDIRISNGALSMDLSNASIHDVARRLSEVGPTNVVVGSGASGTLSGYLKAAPYEAGLRSLLTNHGFEVRAEAGIWTIVPAANTGGGPQSAPGGGGYGMRVTVGDNGRIDLSVKNADVGRVLADIARQLELEVITYQAPQGKITASASDLTLDEALSYLLQGTDVTYRRDQGRYVLAAKTEEGMASSRLLRLEHIKAESLAELLPQSLIQNVALKVVKEQNAVVVTGPGGSLSEIEAFVEEVDNPTPQIMIEALVVDFENTSLFELGAEFGKVEDGESPEVSGDRWSFDEDGFRLEADGEQVTDYKNSIGDWLGWDGIRNIGRLPESFFLSIRALAREGKVDVRSRPQISTLNGHPASISIGTTQYFILRGSTTGAPTPGGAYLPVETERFEKVEANVTLDITPRVTASGEVTVEIRPEFATPVGQFDSSVPPTINTRVIESTVRLRDGETIILGGLIQESKRVQVNKLPILGQIPLLGRLFRNRSHNTRKSELVIFITPHVFQGGEAEQAKWDNLQERYDAEYDE